MYNIKVDKILSPSRKLCRCELHGLQGRCKHLALEQEWCHIFSEGDLGNRKEITDAIWSNIHNFGILHGTWFGLAKGGQKSEAALIEKKCNDDPRRYDLMNDGVCFFIRLLRNGKRRLG